jgi:hypothetical protein
MSSSGRTARLAQSIAKRLERQFRLQLPGAFELARRRIRGRFEIGSLRWIFTSNQMHRKIKQQFGFRGGFYFEVGANDELEQSNTAYLERYLGWRGILVEPAPHKFVECVRNRTRSKVVHAALVP